jgi:DNA polymerase III subunit delta
MSSRRPKKTLDSLDYDKLRRQVKEGRIDPLYLFIGEEQYLQELCLKMLYESVDASSRVFNVAVLTIGSDIGSGSRITAATVIDMANQWPMIAARRVVVVRDFDKIKEDEYELVLNYLKQPSTTSTIVFQAVAPDQRRKVTQALIKSCTVVSFDLLAEDRAKKWAEGFLKLRGASIEPRALDRLVSLVGTRLARLSNELAKLATYAGDQGAISEEAVRELVPRAREHTSWELWDAILERDQKRSIRLINRLLDDDPGAHLMILGAIAGLYRRMLTGKELMSRGTPFQEVLKLTGQYQRANAFRNRLNRTPRADIVHGLHRIAEVDNAIKNAEGTPRLQMENLVVELTLPSRV